MALPSNSIRKFFVFDRSEKYKYYLTIYTPIIAIGASKVDLIASNMLCWNSRKFNPPDKYFNLCFCILGFGFSLTRLDKYMEPANAA